jgi:ornithine cyclodeaminase/alanine dehydrogenase-like protein (mu-crystallin family)
MTLLLANEEVESLLDMPTCLATMEEAYRELAAGRGANGERSEILAPTARDDALYSLLTMSGVVPKFKIGGVRINSDLLTWPRSGGVLKRTKVPAADGRYTGLVLLFDTDSGEPLAVFPDGILQRLRVGATCGLAAKYLARADAQTAALLGTGWQAGGQAMAICAVRPIRRMVCYSPRPESCRAFAQDMAARLGIEVVPAASAQQAMRGADVVVCASNAMQPILSAEWIEPGMHVSSIKRLELPKSAVDRGDVVFTHVRDAQSHIARTAGADLSRETDARKDALTGDIRQDKMPTLTELVTGTATGRRQAKEVTLFLNYAGTGYQFAATGYAVLKRARERGLGREVPTDWFTGTVPS